jgi:hypothetical protein
MSRTAAAGFMPHVALARVMRSLLFGVGALDGPTFTPATGLLIAVALTASRSPARRTVQLGPVTAFGEARAPAPTGAGAGRIIHSLVSEPLHGVDA